ncbi:protein bark beetle isoform X1 [Episyrphus balteatus]|uniref:protein bark beetle isoform X1 n=1 Tax=Episyrphus balteatus TaxID=286459 RepID=UPI002485B74A|nr:protein bark beetle isoform X1 [Episyrphus balteatus]
MTDLRGMSNRRRSDDGRSDLIVIFCVILLCLSESPTVAQKGGSDSGFSENEIDIDGDMPQDTLRRPVTQLRGGEILGERILRAVESPFVVTEDIEVPKGSKLIIEPGVTIEFAPSTGLTVQGVMQAVGTSTRRITLTSRDSSNRVFPDPEELGARLVDGPTPLEGRLQIFHKGQWRSVCTNSRNWTEMDYETMCRQMGFRGGRFWNWIERSAKKAPRLLYEEPNCLGTESSLFDCSWLTRQLGSGVCDYHSDIGVQCIPVHKNVIGHWRGVRFENAPAAKSLGLDNTVYSAISQSSLKYVDILKAGYGREGDAKSALEVLGLPPEMEHIVINHSAYTGINTTLPDGGFAMKNVTVRNSNGIGVFVNSSYGSVKMDGCVIVDNAADGIKYVGHDLRPDLRTDRATIHDFCTLPTTSGQTFPISLSMHQKFYVGAAKECGKYFFTHPGYVLTVHFDYFTVARNESATITIFDGSSPGDRVLTSWNLRNFTRHQAVTSTKDKLYIQFRAEMRTEVLGFIRLTTGFTRTYDLKVVDSVVEDNSGRGIAIDNIRSQLQIQGTTISNNGHVSGVHVTSGAGDVNITQSNISFNKGDGVNITYYGGNRNISKSSISSNQGYGFAVWLNETKDIERKEFIPLNQTTTVEYTDVFNNLETGIQHGNFCAPLWINITGNHFNSSNLDDVYIDSCWFPLKNPNEEVLKLQIGHNLFENSKRNSILLSPALNLIGRIEYNQFRYGSHGSLYIRNQPWDEFNELPVKLIVQNNYFMRNKGVYVVSLGLSPYSEKDVQFLLFTRNFVRENKIREPFGPASLDTGEKKLNPRSRVSAPIVISSSNVDVFRNIISNYDSQYEIGSQLCDQSQIINATYNWLGYTDEFKIYERLFHRNDRYNLAKIQYLPYLLHNSNPGSSTIISIPTFVHKFFNEGSDLLGGEVDGQEMIPSGTYRVNRDINIRPGGKLILQPDVTLKFDPSVGMMVAGKLEARGRRPDDILFTLKRETLMPPTTNDTVDVNGEDVEAIDMETESIMRKEDLTDVPVRLLGGSGEHEGRLQIFLDDRWGTVCDYGWNIINAALVCHHLGYTLNPLDWRLHPSQMPGVGTTEDVIVSNVRCTEHDVDITKCRSERISRGEFENSCSHDNDVGVRCHEGGWAGLRFSMLAERADLQYVTVERAGLFDYKTNSFKPAVQMDFARHNLENVRIVDNLNDGLGVIYSDVFGGKSINNIKNSEFTNNKGDGISLKQLGLRVHGSLIKDNIGSGISHNPVISAVDQRELGGWFKMAPDFNTFDTDYEPVFLPKHDFNFDLGTWQTKYIITEKQSGENLSRKMAIRCQPGYVMGIQLLNPIENRSTERITILDSQTENDRSRLWEVKRDLSVFPVTSSSYGIILYYESGMNALGGAVIMLSTLSAPVQDVRNRVTGGPTPSLTIRSTKIQKNARAISAFYYNRYFGQNGEHYLRKANESIKISNSEISSNDGEALLVKAPFWDVHSSNISEVTIHINNTLIFQNGLGIRHVSKDLRSSNNLFHYALQDNTIESNLHGGLDISLPYVWQYNENFTHSIFLGNNTWRRNRDFTISVKGHYAWVNLTSNLFLDNDCRKGLIALDGMEKKLKFDYNRMENNNGKFVIEVRADSLSEIIGEVPAIFEYNTIKDNRYDPVASYRTSIMRSQIRTLKQEQRSLPKTAVIRFDGVQKVKIHRNLIAQNTMDFDLIAGVRSARLSNFLYAMENWWGSSDPAYIRSRIFDFDNWNNHAEVVFQPYLIENSFDASVSVDSSTNHGKELNADMVKIGGRISRDFVLKRRAEPYNVISDITVMPDVTLTIEFGTVLEFEPNVGILVLGTLNAIGYKDSQIVMKPRPSKTHESYTMLNKRSLENLVSHDSIRLCTARNCSSRAHEDETYSVHEGFLEYFNHTTLQWVPICDKRFTERNAQVVCRELGYDPLNVYYGHDRRIEFHTNSLTRIWSWVQPLECKGDENRLEDCTERLNGQLYGRLHECHWNDEFVFVSCYGNMETDDSTYWGGIRFAHSDFEQNLYENRVHDIRTHGLMTATESRMEHVRIENAGILHNEKSSAIQAIFKNPKITSVSIFNSAHHGINLISPSGSVNLNFIHINNTFGNGLNIISLTGEGRESDLSSFVPLKSLDLSYHLYSLVDICDPNKVITVEERILLYYKYDNNPVNCVKIFNAVYRAKPVGFRLLQSNLFNHSKEYGRPDTIQLYDGDIYNISSKFLGQIEADSSNQNSFFKTTGPTLSIRLIASGAPETHGFIAEVVTVPISAIGLNRDAQHNLTYSQISGTTKSAVTYASAGEVSPTFTLASNKFKNNCRQLYGNFSTCETALRVDVQNMQSFFFTNNLVQGNQGGLYIRADSRGTATSLKGFIQHNLFVRNHNRPTLHIEARQSSPYQEVILYRNYIAQNDARYHDVIRLRQVISNFTYNYVHSNTGSRIMEISGFNKVRLPIYQTTAHNGFYENVATSYQGRATIVAGTAGQQYVDNIFQNFENDYEMITVNNSNYDMQYWNSTIELWKSKVDARHNYWSFNESISVESRIRDKSDDPYLLEVEAVPFQMNNQTILDGKCPPGWTLVMDTCFIYIGAPMPFREARDFCRSDNASMPFIRTDSATLWSYLQSQMQHLKYPEKVWIQDYNHIDKCTSFIFRDIEVEECNQELGFICEIDPKVVIDPLSWRADVFAISIISAFILALILLILMAVCWYAKSKHRHVQRLQRRNSIRQSLRSLNGIDPQGSLRRRNFNVSSSTATLTRNLAQDYKKMESNGSIDSMDKSVLSSTASFDTYEGPSGSGKDFFNQPSETHKIQPHHAKYGEYANQSSLRAAPTIGHANEPRVATIGASRGTSKAIYAPNPERFELSYRNEGYRDNSTFASTRNNSINASSTEDTPIIHLTDTPDIDDVGSDYYGNASTLPLRTHNENLAFLNELKHTLPEYKPGEKEQSHSSFLPYSSNQSQSSTLPYEEKIDNFNFTPVDDNKPRKDFQDLVRENVHHENPADIRRPDSYYTAVRSSKAPPQFTQPSLHSPREANKRPKTVYQTADQDHQPPRSSSYMRSKSEALLETNFDEEGSSSPMNPLQPDSRSYSQPLETAM